MVIYRMNRSHAMIVVRDELIMETLGIVSLIVIITVEKHLLSAGIRTTQKEYSLLVYLSCSLLGSGTLRSACSASSPTPLLYSGDVSSTLLQSLCCNLTIFSLMQAFKCPGPSVPSYTDTITAMVGMHTPVSTCTSSLNLSLGLCCIEC